MDAVILFAAQMSKWDECDETISTAQRKHTTAIHQFRGEYTRMWLSFKSTVFDINAKRQSECFSIDFLFIIHVLIKWVKLLALEQQKYTHETWNCWVRAHFLDTTNSLRAANSGELSPLHVHHIHIEMTADSTVQCHIAVYVPLRYEFVFAAVSKRKEKPQISGILFSMSTASTSLEWRNELK